ncbi:hypothetical protein [Micromonospora inyonensis]|uniref:Uncharacterized protein n=1 Tax=Micromonospora inyonensis TaxID=47866 RepID=A0A1C6SF22_9ACTN|nr:hypothetical protein [Micromonospora inyonensis]SCL28011.1 hypothetical protein GA0074694_4981 [Micromonospora inyonensis]
MRRSWSSGKQQGTAAVGRGRNCAWCPWGAPSNGCQHCDALQGNFFLFHEELMEVLPVNGLDGLDHLADAGIPAAQWWHLYKQSL